MHRACLTLHLARIFIVLRYERHPMYLALTAYSPADPEWRVTDIVWNRDPDKVFPPLDLAVACQWAGE
jgi:hypothetical protein